MPLFTCVIVFTGFFSPDTNNQLVAPVVQLPQIAISKSLRINNYFCRQMKTINHIVTLILAGYMLIAMGGLNVFYHFCTCMNVASTSLMIEDRCCENSETQNDCCGSHETHSCDSETNHNCDCNTEVKVFRVEDAVIAFNTNILVEDISLLGFVDIYFSNEVFNSNQEINVIPLSFAAPPLAGKELVINFHSFKIPENFS